MGTWCCGVFENDEALDWINTLMKGDEIDLVTSALNSVLISNQYIEMRESCEALAAAEIIRSVTRGKSLDLPNELEAWIKGRDPTKYQGLVELASKAVRKVKEESELRDLWNDTIHFEEWNSNLDSLEADLAVK